MAEDVEKSFEQLTIESDMERLATQVKLQKESPENSSVDDQAILKMAIQSATGQTAIKPATTTHAASPYLPNYIENASAETKLEIEYLVDLALRKGIDKAAEEASRSNPFVMDAFHDALTGKLYPEFQKRGLLK